jgi:hypothetical protein
VPGLSGLPDLIVTLLRFSGERVEIVRRGGLETIAGNSEFPGLGGSSGDRPKVFAVQHSASQGHTAPRPAWYGARS